MSQHRSVRRTRTVRAATLHTIRWAPLVMGWVMGLEVREQRRLLGGAVYRRDASVLADEELRAAAVRWPQTGGQLLLRLTPQGRAAATDVLEDVVQTLQERDWVGDDVLVDQLEGRLAAMDHVDLDELASALDGAEGAVLDLDSGRITPAELVEDEEVEHGQALHVPGLGSGASWRDRRSFVDTLPDGTAKDRLARALEGRGAFRRFADELDRHEELVAPFFAWRDERAAARARAWLNDSGALVR